MTFVATPDTPMPESEILRAEQMLRLHEIAQDDMTWLMGLVDDESERPVPRGFKSHRHFEAFKWHQQQRALGRPRQKRRKRAA